MVSFKHLLSRLGYKHPLPVQNSLDQLIDRESLIGGRVFGPVPAGVTRRFFMDKDGEWFFSQTQIDERGLKHTQTIRYQLLANGVLKSVDGRGHAFLQGEELSRLLQATRTYEARVTDQLYGAFGSTSLV